LDFFMFYFKATILKETLIINEKYYMIINKGHLIRFPVLDKSKGTGTLAMEQNKNKINFFKARTWDEKALNFYRKFKWLKEYKKKEGYSLFINIQNE